MDGSIPNSAVTASIVVQNVIRVISTFDQTIGQFRYRYAYHVIFGAEVAGEQRKMRAISGIADRRHKMLICLLYQHFRDTLLGVPVEKKCVVCQREAFV